MSQTCQCGRPVADAWVCAHCVHVAADDCTESGCTSPHLAGDIGELAGLVDELWTVVGRQARYSDRVGGSNGERPLLTNRHVGTLLGSLRNTLTTWIRVVVEERGAQPPTPTAATRTARTEGSRTQVTVQRLTEVPRRCEYSDLPDTDCHHCRETA